MSDDQITGDTIRTLRKQLSLTQEALAREIGASVNTVAKWESDSHHPQGLYRKAVLDLQRKANRTKAATT